MFSDHLQPVVKLPVKKMLAVVAVSVIACQLIAMVLVAKDQVQKAQYRQESIVNAQSLLAACIENSYGSALKKCARLENGETTLAGNRKTAVFDDEKLAIPVLPELTAAK